jgi:hypothetical protein
MALIIAVRAGHNGEVAYLRRSRGLEVVCKFCAKGRLGDWRMSYIRERGITSRN